MFFFSLVIATVNRTEHHFRLIESLYKQTFADFEIILVDQNPHDMLKASLMEHLSPFNLTYLHIKKSLGLSAARNLGLRHASGKVVCFPDDDCWYRPETLELVKRKFDADPALRGITGLVTDEDGQFSAGGYMLRRRTVPVTRQNAWMTTNSSAIFLKRAALNTTGFFDEAIGLGTKRFISGEETDLVLRLVLMGQPVRYYSEINVYHQTYQGKFDRTECRRRYGYGLGMGYILRKNGYNLLNLAFYAAIHIARGGFFLLTLKPKRAWSHFCQAWGRVRGWFEYKEENSSPYTLFITETKEASPLDLLDMKG